MPLFNLIAQTNSIQETTNPKGWIIKTNSSVYQLSVNKDGAVASDFYGSKEQFEYQKPNALWNNQFCLEVPCRGGASDLFMMARTPVLEAIFADNNRECELAFVSAQISEIDGRSVLKIVMKDLNYPLEVSSYIKVYPEYDLLEKWIEVKNTGNKDKILIENLQSGSVSLPFNNYFLRHLAGSWAQEYVQYDMQLTPGTKTIETRNLRSYSPSWYEVYVKNSTSTESNGDVYFGQLAYSGNWRMDFNKTPKGELQIIGGINFSDAHWQLKPNTSFTTPKMLVGYTNNGTEAASQLMVSFVKNEVLPVERRYKMRQVIYNSWYATAFKISEDQQVELAKIAKEIGVETYVVDAGWHEGTIENQSGLGDWTVDLKKFPNGLNSLIKKVNDLGMDFGLWVEPEVVCPTSNLFKNHPDWIFHYSNVKPHKENDRFMLNLAREDVYQYLFKTFSDLLSKNNITFIKWDYGRALTDAGWPSAKADEQREATIRHTANLYRLIESLRAKFPNVWFEACAGGGGRTDLGMMSRMDQVWISDCTDPVDRLFMHYGYLNSYPANTMVCWTADEKWNSFHKQSLPLDYKMNVAMMGVLGVGNDIAKWTPEEIATAKQKITKYKEIRPEVQNGTAYRLVSPYTSNRMAVEYASQDKNKVSVFCFNLGEYLPGTNVDTRQSNALILKGLNPEGTYTLKGTNESYKGSFLMTIGIKWPISGAYISKIIELEKIK